MISHFSNNLHLIDISSLLNIKLTYLHMCIITQTNLFVKRKEHTCEKIYAQQSFASSYLITTNFSKTEWKKQKCCSRITNSWMFIWEENTKPSFSYLFSLCSFAYYVHAYVYMCLPRAYQLRGVISHLKKKKKKNGVKKSNYKFSYDARYDTSTQREREKFV